MSERSKPCSIPSLPLTMLCYQLLYPRAGHPEDNLSVIPLSHSNLIAQVTLCASCSSLTINALWGNATHTKTVTNDQIFLHHTSTCVVFFFFYNQSFSEYIIMKRAVYVENSF